MNKKLHSSTEQLSYKSSGKKNLPEVEHSSAYVNTEMQVILQSLKIKHDASSHVHIPSVCPFFSSEISVLWPCVTSAHHTLLQKGGITIKQSYAQKTQNLATSYTSSVRCY